MLKLEDVQKLDPSITHDDILAYEQTVRELTNNKFHHEHIKNFNLALTGNQIAVADPLIGYRVGDRIEIVSTKYNDGLYTVKEVQEQVLIIEDEFIEEYEPKAFVVKIVYPLDVLNGIKQIINYKHKMIDKVGIKSESIGRMSVSYHDINRTDNVEGIPSAYWSFIQKYRKLKW